MTVWNEEYHCMRMFENKPTNNKKDLWEKQHEIWYGIEVVLWGSWSCLCLKEQLTFTKQKMVIHGGSDYKGFVVVHASYQIDFEAQCFISIVNKGQSLVFA